jgi:hypothetical protein
MQMTVDEIRALLAEATPGPWFVIPSFGKPSVCSDGGWQVAKVSGNRCDDNARLIAAAPTIAALAIAQAEQLTEAQVEIERLRAGFQHIANGNVSEPMNSFARYMMGKKKP